MTDIIWRKKRKNSRFEYCFVSGSETGVSVTSRARGTKTVWFYSDFEGGKDAVLAKIKKYYR